MSKGQKSLEMIVGMIILLVVAAVVINMFLNNVKPPDIPDPKKMKLEQISSTCEQWCEAYSSGDLAAGISYCSEQFSLVGEGEIAERREGIRSYCEDSFYCFLVHDCQLANGQTLNAGRCKELLCQKFKASYLEKKDASEEAAIDYASDKITRLIKKGSCDLGGDESPDNWYTWVFEAQQTDSGWKIFCS